MSKILYPAQAKYLEKFNKGTDPLIEEMELFADQNNIPILSKDSAKFLELLIKITKPKRVLELGTAIAYSSIRIALNLKRRASFIQLKKARITFQSLKKILLNLDCRKKLLSTKVML